MFAIMPDRKCSSCGRTHTLCVEYTALERAASFEYVCPVKDVRQAFSAGQKDWGLVDVVRPPDCVRVQVAKGHDGEQ